MFDIQDRKFEDPNELHPTGRLSPSGESMEVWCYIYGAHGRERCGTRWIYITPEVRASILSGNSPVISNDEPEAKAVEAAQEFAARLPQDTQVPDLSKSVSPETKGPAYLDAANAQWREIRDSLEASGFSLAAATIDQALEVTETVGRGTDLRHVEVRSVVVDPGVTFKEAIADPQTSKVDELRCAAGLPYGEALAHELNALEAEREANPWPWPWPKSESGITGTTTISEELARTNPNQPIPVPDHEIPVVNKEGAVCGTARVYRGEGHEIRSLIKISGQTGVASMDQFVPPGYEAAPRKPLNVLDPKITDVPKVDSPISYSIEYVTSTGTPEEGEKTGNDVNYYVVSIDKPKRLDPYSAECEDIIEALGMTFAEGCAFKAIWRSCAERTLGKKKAGSSSVYDAEKVVYYGKRMLAQRMKG